MWPSGGPGPGQLYGTLLAPMGGKEPGKPGPFQIPLTQLHCPPDAVYEKDAVFDALDDMVDDGILGAYGVSVETVAQGLRAIERPGVATVQVIFNAFRLKPLERLLPACAKADVGVIVRVPLASGLLSGRYTESTTFPPSDHRTYNRAARPSTSARPFRVYPSKSVSGPPAGWPGRPCPGWTLPEVALRYCADVPGGVQRHTWGS